MLPQINKKTQFAPPHSHPRRSNKGTAIVKLMANKTVL